MASKLSDKPITRENLEAFIKTQDDFALELYAYSLARDHGFTASHAGSYSDRVTGKTRQFDVRAHVAIADWFHIDLAIECKSLRTSFPLLVSQIPRLESESYSDLVVTRGFVETPDGRGTFVQPGTLRFKGQRSFYYPHEHVGKALVQVGLNEVGGFVSNDYEVFDKWGQAIASASGLIEQASKRQYQTQERSHVSFVLPVLVVPDFTLWVANYDEFGTLQHGPSQVEEVKFYIGNEQKFEEGLHHFIHKMSHMHVVTKTGLRFLLQRFSKDGYDANHLLSSLPR